MILNRNASMSIRLFLVLILFFLTECIVYAAEKYEVSVESSLNIRSAPNSKSSVLGTLTDGDVIEVVAIKGGWAKFSYKGKDAYINSSYISKAVSADNEPTSKPHRTSLLYLGIILSVILYLIRKFVRKDSPLQGSAFYINYALVAGICALEILYFGVFRGDTWFCSPQVVGWGWSIVNFLIFAWVIYNQAMLFFNTLEDLQYKSYTVDYRTGYYSYGAGLILLLACIFFDKDYTRWVLGGVAIFQLIQVVLIFRYMTPHWGNAAMNALIYLLGVSSTIFIFMAFLPFLIIATIVGVVILGLGSNSGKRKRRCSNCNSFSDGYCNHWKDRVNPESSCSKHHFKDEE